MTTREVTGLSSAPQCSVCTVGPLVLSSQIPGPARGTSASAKYELRWPTTTPLEVRRFAADAIALAFETVALEDGALVVTVVVRD